MKTIKERANELSIIDDDGWLVQDPNIEAACITIANEVIDKACEWLRENAYFSVNCNTGSLDEQDLVERFRKDMTTVPCDSSQVEKKGE